MPRNSVALAALLVVAAGCGKPSEPVWVDTSRLSGPREAIRSEPKETSFKTSVPSATVRLPGMESRTVDGRGEANTAQIREMIREQQDAAYRVLVRRLRRFYEAEIKRFEIGERNRIAGRQRELMDAALGDVRTVFEGYADRRAPVVARLALIEDEAPTTGRQWTLAKQRAPEVSRLRQDLQRIESDYRRQIESVLAESSEQISQLFGQVVVRLEEFRAELERRAEDEARLQVRSSARELGLQLVQRPVALPAVPASESRLPATSMEESAPSVRSEMPSRATIEQEVLAQDLRIWAAVRGYRIVKRSTGRDATQEFIRWRSQRMFGR